MTLTGMLVALLVKPSAVVGVAYVVTTVLRRAVAPVRHAMWLAAIVVILALPVLGAVLPAIHVGLFDNAVRQVSTLVSPQPQGFAGAPATRERRDRPAPVSSPNDFTPVISGRLVAVLAYSIWAAVALVLVRRRILAERRAMVIADGAHAASRRVRQTALHAFSRWRSRETGVRVTDHVSGPVVVGLRKPVVLLPASIESHSDADLETILMHEVGHVKRRDCLTNFIADLAACLYWCNPLVRRAAARMQLEGERSCDEGVVRGGADVVAYAHLLLSIARAGQGRDALAPAARAMSRARELESRIVALMDTPARQPLGGRRSALALTLGVSLTLPAAAISPGARVPVAPLAVHLEQGPDTVASPESERVPLVISDGELTAPIAEVLAGPDSALALPFIQAMGRAPLHQHDLVAERARWVITRVSRGRLVEPLIESLSDTDWRVKAYAAWALGTVHDSRAVPDLIGLVRHPVWRLRAMAAYALAASGDQRAAGVLREALNDPAWQVREQAVRYFAGINSDDARALVLRARDDKHVAVRMAAER